MFGERSTNQASSGFGRGGSSFGAAPSRGGFGGGGGGASSNYSGQGGYGGGFTSRPPSSYGAPSSFTSGSYGGGFERRGGMAGAGLRAVDWKNVNLAPLKKNVYVESPSVANRSTAEIDAWVVQNQVMLGGDEVPRPVLEFNESGFPSPVVEMLYKAYQQPTVIQSISWPVALSGLDMISIAKTGSGKTLGFLLPGIMHIVNQEKRKPGEGPSVVILLPTRELAQQVAEVAQQYFQLAGLTYTCLYGGSPKPPQQNDLRRGVDAVVATPGRLLDFLEAGVTTMSRCSYLVLDEADRMLDMGFEPQIRKIVSQIRPDRQTLMFSATWPKEVRNLARDFQTNPVFLNVGSMDLAANHNIEQIVEVIEEYGKRNRLYQILEQLLMENDAKILIFVETKRKADDLTREMRMGGWPALSIHGDKEQRERNWVLAEFKSGKVPILLATDVAARGLDVDNIKHVINFDYPNNSEDYVHRIGRTGRRDKKGVAYTFFTSQNAPKARDLIKVLEEAGQVVPPELRNIFAPVSSSHSYGKRGSYY